MKPLLIFLVAGFSGIVFEAFPQSLVGTWQLVNQTTCIGDELEEDDAETAALVEEMKSMSGGTSKVLRFKDNQNGEESIRLITTRKSAKVNSFMYKFDGDNLYLLDKKSRLLLGSYIVETVSSDSLIFSNKARPCETRVFVRIRNGK